MAARLERADFERRDVPDSARSGDRGRADRAVTARRAYSAAVMSFLHLSMLCDASDAFAACCELTLSNSPIVRDVLDNGLRILTERMTQVRSISIGVWLTRGSRHETAERGGIAHFVEHMLFKGTGDAIGRGHRAGDRLDRRPARRVHREGIRQLLHQGARRAPAARHRHPLRHRPQPGVQRRTTSSARRRSSSKRSRWSRTRPTTSSTSSSRRASGRIIRSAGRFSAPRRRSSRSTRRLLRDYFDGRLHARKT